MCELILHVGQPAGIFLPVLLEPETLMKLDTPWYWAALAAIVPAGAAVGTGGLLAGHAAIVVITLGIFFGTLSIGRHASPQTASATPIPPPVAEDRKALAAPPAPRSLPPGSPGNEPS